ncbi:MAG: N-6 DNA methylase [Candidatus Aenigmatarchaeota archaeon]
MIDKKFILGQYFTRVEIVKKVINLILNYKKYNKNIRILEPSFGTGNFIWVLKEKGFSEIKGCEIDPEFTKEPIDFFLYPLDEKFDLIIGNPPFTKYNIKESYYYPKKYFPSAIHPRNYLTSNLVKKDKIKIENAFILKSIHHLKDENSTIGFVLPISFFIKGKNLEIKKEILNRFSTIIIYQNDKKWVDEPIPCCFAIFTNIEDLKDKVVLLYEDGNEIEKILNKSSLLIDELIPKSFLYKKNNRLFGTRLSKFLSNKRVKYKKSYKENNISGANITEKMFIPNGENISDYYLAVCRVGNASVGRSGLINIKKDILNDMFYVFEFKEEYTKDKELKEKICRLLNNNQEHFKNLTFRVGSKSIKKEDILEFKI